MRTKLIDRRIPEYTRGVEIFSMSLSIIASALSAAALVFCVIVSSWNMNKYGVVSSSIYGAAALILYTMSSIYHGLKKYIPKKVFQILAHCAIYFFIAGTYTVVSLSAIRQINPIAGWTIFGIEWGIAALAITFTSVDLEKYKILSIVCYAVMSLAILPIYGVAVKAMDTNGFALFMSGLVFYVISLIVYMFEKRMKYLHCIFHMCFLLGSVFQFFSIIKYCL